MYLGSFYRPPDKIDNDYLEEFNISLGRIMSNRNAHVLIGGDFNCGDIEWSTMQVPHGVQKRQTQQQLLDIIGEHCLTQVVNIPTRLDKTLELLFTNVPSPVNRVKGMPPIGKADHDLVYIEYDIKAKRIKQASRKIYLYNRADMSGLRDHMSQFKESYLSEDLSHMSVNEMWVKFKTGFLEAVERFIPSKMTKTKYSLPWIDATIKQLMKRRQKLYLRARKSTDPDVKNHYKRFRAHVQQVERDAYWRHVSNIFTFENDPSDPDSNKSGKIKKFWSFVKSLKKDTFGITSLRENGILKTDTKEKADICNRQFQSAFTREDDSDPPSKGASPFSSMGEITVDPKGVAKLLDGLNVHKAPDPDGLNARVLKECSTQISPILALIYNESLAQGNVPDDWRQFGSVCARYHQQPGWCDESGAHADRFDHHGFRKGLRQGPTQEAITQTRLLWDTRVHPQVDQLMALWAQSTSSFRWSSLRSSPCFIRCTPGVGLRTDPFSNFH